jgi:hypothetical protein
MIEPATPSALKRQRCRPAAWEPEAATITADEVLGAHGQGSGAASRRGTAMRWLVEMLRDGAGLHSGRIRLGEVWHA